jgi:hypothetical protein
LEKEFTGMVEKSIKTDSYLVRVMGGCGLARCVLAGIFILPLLLCRKLLLWIGIFDGHFAERDIFVVLLIIFRVWWWCVGFCIS